MKCVLRLLHHGVTGTLVNQVATVLGEPNVVAELRCQARWNTARAWSPAPSAPVTIRSGPSPAPELLLPLPARLVDIDLTDIIPWDQRGKNADGLPQRYASILGGCRPGNPVSSERPVRPVFEPDARFLRVVLFRLDWGPVREERVNRVVEEFGIVPRGGVFGVRDFLNGRVEDSATRVGAWRLIMEVSCSP